MTDINSNLTLLFENDSPTQTASMNVGWCISQKLRRKLIERKVERPYVLIVVADDKDFERRYLVPFEKTRQLIQFYRAGKHEIHAALVWAKGLRFLKKRLLSPSQEEGTYGWSVWNGYRDTLDSGERGEWIVHETESRERKIKDLRASIEEKAEEVDRFEYRIANPEEISLVPRVELPDYLNLEFEGSETEIEQAEKRLETVKSAEKTLDSYLGSLRLASSKADVESNREKLEISNIHLKEDMEELERLEASPELEQQRELRHENGVLVDEISGEGYARREINITEGFFAPEYPPLLKKWVNLWYDRPHRDQCQFRGRALVAIITLKPLWAVVLVVLKVIARILNAAFYTGLLGVRGFNPKPIWHPFSQTIDDVIPHDDISNNWVQRDSDGLIRGDGERYVWEFTRPVWYLASILLVGTIDKIVARYSEDGIGLFSDPSLLAYAVAGIGVVVAIFLFLVMLAVIIYLVVSAAEFIYGKATGGKKAISTKLRKWRAARKKRKPAKPNLDVLPSAVELSRFETLVCSANPTFENDGIVETIRKVPFATVPSLLYDEIKGAVCKPVQH